MAVPRQIPQVVRFGAYEVNLETGELLKNGNRLKIQEHSFQLLVALLQRQGQLVTREELRNQLWPTDTFVDFDNGLNKAVARLREVLGDSTDGPRYIETLARRGYRFICPVETPRPAAASLPARFPAEMHPYPPLRSRWVGLVAPVIGVLTVAGVFLSLRRAASPVSPAAGRIILAVLPFENLTGDQTQDYFSDGLTEEMITQLGGLAPDRLGVIARTSAMHYKRTTETAAQISRELHADYLLEGSVRREDLRVRVSAQLIRARDETHVWAQDYDRDVHDNLDLESEISHAVASQIEIKLSTVAALQPRRALNPDAYEAYLKGRYFWNRRSEAGYRKAISFFEQATALDPGYAQAYAGLADAYSLLGSNPTSAFSRQEAMRRARAAALRALTIDETVGEAHTSLAFIYWHYDWNWPAAEREFRRALTLNPSYPTAHHWYAFYLVSQGHLDQAVREIRQAQEFDPLSSIINTDVGEILLYNRQYDLAIAQELRTLEINPDFALAWRVLAVTYLQKHEYDHAFGALHRAMDIPGDTTLVEGTLGVAYALTGQDHLARRIARELENDAERLHMEELYLSIAEVYSALGNKDLAFLWLEKDYQTHDGGLTIIQVVPFFDWLHTDPRFHDLVHHIGLRQQ